MKKYNGSITKKVMVVMGSKSDMPVAKKALEKLEYFNIETRTIIASAHRTPDFTANLAKTAKSENFGVIIAVAGMAAHLAGVFAANTTIPVIGVPVKSSIFGLDALLSTVQMPPGVPVAAVGIDCAENAAILAAQILSLSDENLNAKLVEIKSLMESKIVEDNKNINLK